MLRQLCAISLATEHVECHLTHCQYRVGQTSLFNVTCALVCFYHAAQTVEKF